MNQLKQFTPYLTLADNIEPTNLPFAYYIRKYATDKVYQVYQNYKSQNSPHSQEIYPHLDAMIKKTEQLNRHLEGQVAQMPNVQDILNYADRLFAQADEELRNHRGTPEVGQNFQNAWRLYEVVNYFSKLSDDHDKRRQYAKAKGLQLCKVGGMQHSVFNPPPPQQHQSHFMHTQSILNTGNTAQGKKKRIDPEKIIAQTHAINELQNAVSELEFNRINYAKEAVRKALTMMEKYQD